MAHKKGGQPTLFTHGISKPPVEFFAQIVSTLKMHAIAHFAAL